MQIVETPDACAPLSCYFVSTVSSQVSDETMLDFGPLRPKDPLVGSLVENYEIQSLIGQGSMGIVYRGLHTLIGKPVAIKVLKLDFAGDNDMVQRLIREARSVNSIRHPGIVDVFGFGTIPQTGQPFIVMDLLEGEALDSYIGRLAPLPFKTAFPILDELLSALSAAHHVGVIHRDLKPGNIFLERHPDGRHRVKLLDFGLARQADRSGGSINPTTPGMLMGTPAFMAPEQILGERIGPHTDLYAVGGIAYQMVTGRLAHEAPGSMEILSLKLKSEPPTPRQFNSRLTIDFERWILQLLKRDPHTRLRDAEEARRQLQHLAEGKTVLQMPQASMPKERNWSDAKTILVGDPTASPSVDSNTINASLEMQVPGISTDPMWTQPSSVPVTVAVTKEKPKEIITPASLQPQEILTDQNLIRSNRPAIFALIAFATIVAGTLWLLFQN